MKKSLCVLFLLWCFESHAKAEIPGTARSNERDILRLDVGAGLSVSCPGVMAGGSALWTMMPADAVGLSMDYGLCKLKKEDARLLSQSYDIIWEHSIALFEGFHALRFRFGAGASKVARSSVEPYEKDKPEGRHRAVWGGHGLFGLAIDLPIADLMWMRLGVQTEKVFLDGVPAQSSLFVSWVFGGQWIGIGD